MSRRVALAVGLVALAVRLAFFAQHLASPLVDVPPLDAHYYDLLARGFVAGSLPEGLATGFRSLLYPRLLAAVYAITGSWGLFAALGLQHLLGVATALLVAGLAGALFRSDRAALAGGLLYAVAGPPLFFEGQLLVESTFLAVAAASLLGLATLDEAEGRRRPIRAGAVGVLLALGVRLRPTLLLFVALLPLLLLRREGRASRRAVVAAVLGGALVGLVALGAWERPHTGRFELLPGAGGVNLYLGNKRTADGMVPRQDWNVTYAEGYRDSVEVFSEEAFRRDRGLDAEAEIDSGALSRYWLLRTAEEFGADPLGRLRLLGRKIFLLLWNHEVANNRSFAFASSVETPILRWLPVRFGVLAALALAGGLALARSRVRGTGPDATWLFLGSQAAAVVLFFVTSRYRLPLWPALAALGGGGLESLVSGLARRDWSGLRRPVTAAACGALVAFPNWTGASPPGPGRDLLYWSVALRDHGRLAESRVAAEKAVELEPLNLPPYLNLAQVCAELHDPACAEASYGRVLELHPEHVGALVGLGESRERRGDVAGAFGLYCRAVRSEPRYPGALVRLALLELRAGRDEEAGRRLDVLPEGARGRLDVRVAAAELEARRRGDGVPRRVGIHPSEERAAIEIGELLDRPLPAGLQGLGPCTDVDSGSSGSQEGRP